MAGYKNIVFAALALANGIATQAQKPAQILLTNPSSLQRDDELIVISRKQLEEKTGRIPPSKCIVVSDKSRQPLVVQNDDKNGDALWDEIVLLSSFQPFEKKALTVSFSNKPFMVKAQVKAHVRHRRKNAEDMFGVDLRRDTIPAGQPPTDFTQQALPPFLTEGPAWENDKVGFRLYFDTRNTKDIWGKTTTRLVLDEVGTDPAKNYHQLSDWGMDILKVGKSLGAGGLALEVKQASGPDTLVRLGGVNMGKVIYEKVADGPLRATFRLHYPEWKLLNQLPPLQVMEEISIWGGQYFYESRVIISGAPANARLVTGIVNLASNVSRLLDTAGTVTLYSYDAQSENKDRLGMAIQVDKQQYVAAGKAPERATDVQSTYTLATALQSRQPVVFRFFAGWEKSDPQFLSAQGFEDFLLRQALLHAHPITCSVR